MTKTSPAQFVREVRAEGRKIHWPTRKETALSTVMVLIMSALTAAFFLLIDQILKFGIQSLLTF